MLVAVRSRLWAVGLVLAVPACAASPAGPPKLLTASRAPSVSAEASPTHNPGHSPPGSDPLGIHAAPELQGPYLTCARENGFDPQVAHVFVDHLDKPMFVKTGYEVPADVHRACLMELGGDDPHSTSYGN